MKGRSKPAASATESRAEVENRRAKRAEDGPGASRRKLQRVGEDGCLRDQRRGYRAAAPYPERVNGIITAVHLRRRYFLCGFPFEERGSSGEIALI